MSSSRRAWRADTVKLAAFGSKAHIRSPPSHSGCNSSLQSADQSLHKAKPKIAKKCQL
jgi:hypothetical protein